MKASSDSSSKSKNSKKKITDVHLQQIRVLRTLSSSQATTIEPRRLQINEISQLAGLQDEKEVQRYLFILEGQKLVSPFPEGDFTSKTWFITRNGVRALKTIQSSGMVNN